jgi:hypothetical protein
VQRILRAHGSKFVEAVWREGAPQPPHGTYEDDEADDTSLEPADSKPGFLGRLIGRDLADNENDVPDRADPPMQSAPTPHVDPADRVAPTGETMELSPEPAAPVPRAVASPLGRDDLHKLHAVLHELRECRKLVDTALAR